MKVYLASPFFNDVEIERMENVKKILREEKGFEVFAPFENQNKHLEFGSKEWRDATFAGDINGIDTADIVVAIISNGNYSDSGTAWECGYAYATKKPVIIVNLSDKAVNLMISDSLTAYLSSLDELRAYDFEKMPRKTYDNYVW
ncbi:nucleoside 2-deoxyribosyltransferase [Clostridium mediterraneense]|uniref:nucleoside 2-deoxyribosyltransferase n=1 Tax=Clostridium mediterraneense TaxID=1805472 RepID=UPI00083492B0|nr:nucleoside 2-deoxyribosyltransferase [Clostridium mediterraneense]